jgi:hypothetical protein
MFPQKRTRETFYVEHKQRSLEQSPHDIENLIGYLMLLEYFESM